MSTLLNLLAWLLPRRQAESQRTSKLVTRPQNVFANYRHGRAIVASLILPGQSGRVWFKASWWPARCPLGIPLYQGQAVRVIDIDRITLIVEPILEAIPTSPTVAFEATPALPLSAPIVSALDPARGVGVTPVDAAVKALVSPVGYTNPSAP